MLSAQVVAAIERFTPRLVSLEAAAFAKKVTTAAAPDTVNRAKAYLFGPSRPGGRSTSSPPAAARHGAE